MKTPLHSLPDPLLPEHELIRQAAPHPVLSRELRQRVLDQCGHQVWLSRWKTRLKIGGAVLIACSLLMLLSVNPPTQPDTTVETPSAPVQPAYPSPGYQSPGSASGSNLADDHRQRDPNQRLQEQTVPPKEAEQINILIEELKDREKNLCGFLPWI